MKNIISPLLLSIALCAASASASDLVFDGKIDSALLADVNVIYQSLDKKECHFNLFEGEVCTPTQRQVSVFLAPDADKRFHSVVHSQSETGFGPFKERFEFAYAEIRVSVAGSPNQTVQVMFLSAKANQNESPATQLDRLVVKDESLVALDATGKNVGEILSVDLSQPTVPLRFNIEAIR